MVIEAASQNPAIYFNKDDVQMSTGTRSTSLSSSSNRISDEMMQHDAKPFERIPSRLMENDMSHTSGSTSSPEDEDDVESRSSESDELERYGDAEPDFLVKPMSLLPVCPVDDLAVEEERRRRRCARMKKQAKHERLGSEAESLPTLPSMLLTRRGNESVESPPSTTLGSSSDNSQKLLRRDSMAIRQHYWKQLGLNMNRRDLERNTNQRRKIHVGVKVRLNDLGTPKGESKSILQMLSSWYGNPSDGNRSAEANDDQPCQPPRMTPTQRKSLRFKDEAEMFYIPLHNDYSKRQRDGMWHTRSEFIAMVERNLEELYDEMERECEAEAAENDAMEAEETRQREYEAQRQAVEAKAAKAAAALVSPPYPRPNGQGASPPNLSLCPEATHIKVTSRARSSHDIRFKYLKHLGIKNS